MGETVPKSPLCRHRLIESDKDVVLEAIGSLPPPKTGETDGVNWTMKHRACKDSFPLYGREGPDSCPNFDQFGSGAVALQRMLVQEGGGKIYLLPAWPANWDVDFKLHLSGNAVVSG